MNPSPESLRFLNTSSFPSLGESSQELSSAVSMFVGKYGVPLEYRVDDGRSFELTPAMENIGSNEYNVNWGHETSSNRNNHAKTDNEFELAVSNSKVGVEGSTEVRTEEVRIEVIYLGDVKVKEDWFKRWNSRMTKIDFQWFMLMIYLSRISSFKAELFFGYYNTFNSLLKIWLRMNVSWHRGDNMPWVNYHSTSHFRTRTVSCTLTQLVSWLIVTLQVRKSCLEFHGTVGSMFNCIMRWRWRWQYAIAANKSIYLSWYLSLLSKWVVHVYIDCVHWLCRNLDFEFWSDCAV